MFNEIILKVLLTITIKLANFLCSFLFWMKEVFYFLQTYLLYAFIQIHNIPDGDMFLSVILSILTVMIIKLYRIINLLRFFFIILYIYTVKGDEGTKRINEIQDWKKNVYRRLKLHE